MEEEKNILEENKGAIEKGLISSEEIVDELDESLLESEVQADE